VLVAMRVYSAVVSSLWPAGHRLDYVPYRTMSCRAVTRFAVNANSWMDGT
jgi:hypothetical protein